MRVVGIVAEYNPFHRGHLKQFQELRSRHRGKTAIVIVLSSYFTQRGIPALLSPRQRAQVALESGADLVLLLPQIFSSADAEGFARGAMSLMLSSGVVHGLCFGSELTDLSLHEKCAEYLSPESDELKTLTADLLTCYGSPHLARKAALTELGADPACLSCLDYANSRLGVEYLAQLRQLSGQSRPLKYMISSREGELENDLSLHKGQASAKAIRYALSKAAGGKSFFRIRDWQPELGDLLPRHMPSGSLAMLMQSAAESGLPLDNAFLDIAVQRLLSAGSADRLIPYRYWGKDLSARLWESYRRFDSRDGLPLPEDLRSKNFTSARIRRALLSLLLGIRGEEWEQAGKEAAFIHPLGFTADGKYLLRKMKSFASLPILSSITGKADSKDSRLLYQLNIDRNAGFLWHKLNGSRIRHDFLPPLEVKRKA